MKHRKTLKILLAATILAEAVGAILNRIVVYLNRGMPTAGLAQAFGKWVALNQETKLPLLADIISIGPYTMSTGDLFFIAGLVTGLIALWIVLPQGRQFFPLLIFSIFGIILSTPIPNDVISVILFQFAAIGTILAMYLKYRSINKTAGYPKSTVIEGVSHPRRPGQQNKES
jgi:hypothetical protein